MWARSAKSRGTRMPPEPELSRRSKIGSAKLFQIRKVSQNLNMLYDTFLHMFWDIYIYWYFSTMFSPFFTGWPTHATKKRHLRWREALLRGRGHQAAAVETDAAGKPGVSVGNSGGTSGATKKERKTRDDGWIGMDMDKNTWVDMDRYVRYRKCMGHQYRDV